ncbi:hypothetical protein DYB32_000680 [Aphanomyces invadans]|uniref:Fibronectin type-III domain-containing protein n=1 Tax=Aphanomyces invadans TaxID=157072 RepID=A0A3R7D6Z7_9STRA|nr:hypothetical protein DYB32_000680 [Aphanomyces invadans]
MGNIFLHQQIQCSACRNVVLRGGTGLDLFGNDTMNGGDTDESVLVLNFRNEIADIVSTIREAKSRKLGDSEMDAGGQIQCEVGCFGVTCHKLQHLKRRVREQLSFSSALELLVQFGDAFFQLQECTASMAFFHAAITLFEGSTKRQYQDHEIYIRAAYAHALSRVRLLKAADPCIVYPSTLRELVDVLHAMEKTLCLAVQLALDPKVQDNSVNHAKFVAHVLNGTTHIMGVCTPMKTLGFEAAMLPFIKLAALRSRFVIQKLIKATATAPSPAALGASPTSTSAHPGQILISLSKDEIQVAFPNSESRLLVILASLDKLWKPQSSLNLLRKFEVKPPFALTTSDTDGIATYASSLAADTKFTDGLHICTLKLLFRFRKWPLFVEMYHATKPQLDPTTSAVDATEVDLLFAVYELLENASDRFRLFSVVSHLRQACEIREMCELRHDVLVEIMLFIWHDFAEPMLESLSKTRQDQEWNAHLARDASRVLMALHVSSHELQFDDIVWRGTLALHLANLLDLLTQPRLAIQILRVAQDVMSAARDAMVSVDVHDASVDTPQGLALLSHSAINAAPIAGEDIKHPSPLIQGTMFQQAKLGWMVASIQTEIAFRLYGMELQVAKARSAMTLVTVAKRLRFECNQNGYLRGILAIQLARFKAKSARPVQSQSTPMHSKPRAPLLVSRGSTFVTIEIVPYNPRGVHIAYYCVFGKGTGAGTDVSLNNMEFPGTGTIRATVSGLLPNESYVFAVAAYDAHDQVVEGIGATSAPILTLNPLVLTMCYGILAKEAANLNHIPLFSHALRIYRAKKQTASGVIMQYPMQVVHMFFTTMLILIDAEVDHPPDSPTNIGHPVVYTAVYKAQVTDAIGNYEVLRIATASKEDKVAQIALKLRLAAAPYNFMVAPFHVPCKEAAALRDAIFLSRTWSAAVDLKPDQHGDGSEGDKGPKKTTPRDDKPLNGNQTRIEDVLPWTNVSAAKAIAELKSHFAGSNTFFRLQWVVQYLCRSQELHGVYVSTEHDPKVEGALTNLTTASQFFYHARAWTNLQACVQTVWNMLWAKWLSPASFQNHYDWRSLYILSMRFMDMLDMLSNNVAFDDANVIYRSTVINDMDERASNAPPVQVGSIPVEIDIPWAVKFVTYAIQVLCTAGEWERLVLLGKRVYDLTGSEHSDQVLPWVVYAQSQRCDGQRVAVATATDDLSQYVKTFEELQAKKKKKKSRLVVHEVITEEERNFREERELKEIKLRDLIAYQMTLQRQLVQVKTWLEHATRSKNMCLQVLHRTQKAVTKQYLCHDKAKDILAGFKSTISLCRQKRATLLLVQVLQEQGDYLFGEGDIPGAAKSWNDGIDAVFGALAATTNWRSIVPEATLRIDGDNMWVIIMCCNMLGKLAWISLHDNLNQRLEYALMNSAAFCKLFTCALQHPNVDELHTFSNYTIYPAFATLASKPLRYIQPASILLMSTTTIETLLTNGKFAQALPLACGMQYFASRHFHDTRGEAQAKRMKFEACVGMGHMDQAVCILSDLLSHHSMALEQSKRIGDPANEALHKWLLEFSVGKLVALECMLAQSILALQEGLADAARAHLQTAMKRYRETTKATVDDTHFDCVSSDLGVLFWLRCRIQWIKCDLMQGHVKAAIEGCQIAAQEAQTANEAKFRREIQALHFQALVLEGSRGDAEKFGMEWLKNDDAFSPTTTRVEVLLLLSYMLNTKAAASTLPESSLLASLKYTQAALDVMNAIMKEHGDGLRALAHVSLPDPKLKATLLYFRGCVMRRQDKTSHECIPFLVDAMQIWVKDGRHPRKLMHRACMELVQVYGETNHATGNDKDKQAQAAYHYLVMACTLMEQLHVLWHTTQVHVVTATALDKLSAPVQHEILSAAKALNNNASLDHVGFLIMPYLMSLQRELDIIYDRELSSAMHQTMATLHTFLLHNHSVYSKHCFQSLTAPPKDDPEIPGGLICAQWVNGPANELVLYFALGTATNATDQRFTESPILSRKVLILLLPSE